MTHPQAATRQPWAQPHVVTLTTTNDARQGPTEEDQDATTGEVTFGPSSA